MPRLIARSISLLMASSLLAQSGPVAAIGLSDRLRIPPNTTFFTDQAVVQALRFGGHRVLEHGPSVFVVTIPRTFKRIRAQLQIPPPRIPTSYALSGRHGQNELTWPKKAKPVEFSKLTWLLDGLTYETLARLSKASATQHLTYYVTNDPQGPLMLRRGNEILVNEARSDLRAAVRLNALFHDIEGHDWEWVEKHF
jgi:hypothetical protein